MKYLFSLYFLLLYLQGLYAQELRYEKSLNGSWEFRLLAPDSTGWNPITVPWHPEFQGYFAPEFNTSSPRTMEYRRKVSIPDEWRDKKLFLHFGGVHYASHVFWNDSLLYSHASGYTAFEIPLSAMAQAGSEAILKVVVDTKGEDYFFDNLDFWSLTGIYRDVKLIARSQHFIDFWNYKTQWNDDLATVTIYGKINQPITSKVKVTLDWQGETVVTDFAKVKNGEFRQEITVSKPFGWTAETPNLYQIKLELVKGNQVIDLVRNSIGLREITIEGGRLFINKRPIRIYGTARHDLWPTSGRAIGEDVSRKDLELMKATGVNAVRTAHHPPESTFLKLADQLGIYVIDNIPMSNVTGQVRRDSLKYEAAARLRAYETVRRDVLHPSVIVWAMGNENGMLYTHEVMHREIHRWDATRPTIMPGHYGDQKIYPEILSQHYPVPGYSLLSTLYRHPQRPLIATEYQHAAFGGIGGMEFLWRQLDLAASGTGGTQWEWMDQGILHNYPEGGQKATWPDIVTIQPGQDFRSIPQGFGLQQGPSPHSINIKFKAEEGAYTFEFGILSGKEENLLEINYDGKFAAWVTSKTDSFALYTIPLDLTYDGDHTLTLKWNYLGGGLAYDYLSLSKNTELVWQIGNKDKSAAEFSTTVDNGMRMDIVQNQAEDGVLNPDRTPEDDYHHLKAAYAPLRLTWQKSGVLRNEVEILFENRYSFTDLVDVPTQIVYQYFDQGELKQDSMAGPLLTLPALSQQSFSVKLPDRDQLAAIGIKVPALTDHQPDPLGMTWINLSSHHPNASASAPEPITLTYDNEKIILQNGDLEIIFDKNEGGLTRLSRKGEVLIDHTLELGIWRPSLEHEQLFRLRYYKTRQKNSYTQDYYEKWLQGDIKRIAGYADVYQFPDHTVVTFYNTYQHDSLGKVMQGIEKYILHNNGELELKSSWEWLQPTVHVLRLGYNISIPARLNQLYWSGYGPWANYQDATLGVDDKVHHLIKDNPALASNKTNVKWLKWQDEKSTLYIQPGWAADIQAITLPKSTLQMVSRAAGVGNKYAEPFPAELIWLHQHDIINLDFKIITYAVE